MLRVDRDTADVQMRGLNVETQAANRIVACRGDGTAELLEVLPHGFECFPSHPAGRVEEAYVSVEGGLGELVDDVRFLRPAQLYFRQS
jgi:hypothetical protein